MFGNANARIDDREPERVRVRFCRRGVSFRDLDRDAARLGEFHGVSDEIEQHLAQPARISVHVSRRGLVYVAGECQAFFLGSTGH